MVRVICAKLRLPTICDHRCSMSATRPPASAISACPRFVRSMSFARPSAGSGRRVRYPKLDEVVHQLRGGSQAQLRPVGQLGEPNAAHPDVAEDLEVRLSDIAVSGIGTWRGEVVTKLS